MKLSRVTEWMNAVDRPGAPRLAGRRAGSVRFIPGLAALLLSGSVASGATPSKAQSLARFDVGYAQCEKRFEHMRGHRDEAYAGLHRLKLDAKLREQLAAARKTSVYKSTSREAARTLANDKSADLDQRLDQQCQALWREAIR